MTMKMRLKMKNKSHRYGINGPRARHTYTKYKIYLNMMVICIKEHPSKI